MTISDIGSIGELVGGIATIATLIYLAVQIRESTRLSRRQALDHGVDRLSEWGGRFIDNPEALKLYLDGLEHFESSRSGLKNIRGPVVSQIGDSKAPCAGNGGSISKCGNAASADLRAQPEGPGPFFRISAFVVAT